MVSKFDKYILKMLLEQEGDPKEQGAPPDAAGEAPEGAGDAAPPPEGEDPGQGGEENLGDELGQEAPVFPEELELAKLAIRALYFNVDSKDVHKLKLKTKNQTIPFEKISDYFEKTKKILPILGFVEWAMDRYEGVSSKWTEQPEIRGQSIINKIKMFNSKLPEENRLDNGKRVYWTRIILNCLLRGNPNLNINISDVNERTIKDIFRVLKQNFGTDTRGPFMSINNLRGPATF